MEELFKQVIDGLESYPYIFEITKVLFVALISFIGYLLTRLILSKIVRRLVFREIPDPRIMRILDKFLRILSYITPLIIIDAFSYLFVLINEFLQTITDALIVVAVLAAINYFIDSVVAILAQKSRYRNLPFKSYGQIVKVVFLIFGIVIIIAILTNQSPWTLLGGLSAMTAVLLLIFRDTILSFVASIQISSYDLIKVGDWIEVPQFGADGDVIDISLNVVKVQNWDKTITTIPTYKLVDNSFKNWKGMTQTGGRRISRSINVDIKSVKFCDEQMIEKFRRISALSDYLDRKTVEIKKWNEDHKIDNSVLVNGRRMTNIGVFRAYLNAYLERRKDVNKNLTYMVRQLAPTEYGIPIQIYVFTATTKWIEYEAIQSDIFDHIFAVVPFFELQIFQLPSGTDFHQASLQLT
jgi:miniconductance mechanosensitive channel